VRGGGRGDEDYHCRKLRERFEWVGGKFALLDPQFLDEFEDAATEWNGV